MLRFVPARNRYQNVCSIKIFSTVDLRIRFSQFSVFTVCAFYLWVVSMLLSNSLCASVPTLISILKIHKNHKATFLFQLHTSTTGTPLPLHHANSVILRAHRAGCIKVHQHDVLLLFCLYCSLILSFMIFVICGHQCIELFICLRILLFIY